MISLINSESRIPRIIIGFIVCDLIQDVLSIACLFPAKDAVYRYVFERMVLCVRMVFFCFFFYIIENIFYIIYSVNYEDRNDYDNAYLIINIIVGFSLFVILLASSRNLLRTLKRIKEIKEMAAARAHVQS